MGFHVDVEIYRIKAELRRIQNLLINLFSVPKEAICYKCGRKATAIVTVPVVAKTAPALLYTCDECAKKM